ncbi:hypothetical protein [Hymenobacter cellulosivorans]|uniref:Uncharacterized protein n=1 Tax=Hymenobacter cellulosivorans TaxID=2932249 RepID=A0ABY4F7Y7_9BACT|nr:hypothetical protein [Hymenobacter cellulosivorans]UOQ52564.1 hypothetical protein MUN80_22785 [Hymenobacter cellulosivorans]
MCVGFQAKALTVAGHLAPRIIDKVMEKLIYPSQLDPKRPSRNPETSDLHERSSDEGWFR